MPRGSAQELMDGRATESEPPLIIQCTKGSIRAVGTHGRDQTPD